MLLAIATPALAQPVLGNVSPAAVNFGPVKFGATVSIPVTVANLAGVPVGISSDGLSAPGFALDGATCAQMEYLLPAGRSCHFIASFTPTDNTGTPFTARLALLLSGAPGTQVAIVDLHGSGAERLVQVSPVGIDFGRSFIGQQVNVPVTVTNTHSGPVSFAGGGVPTGPFRADSGNCPASLPAGSACSFNYSFTASDTAPAQTSTSVGAETTSPSAMQDYFQITLKGQGTATLPVPNVAVWPAAIDFGSVQVGQNATAPVNFTNNGAQAVTSSGGGFSDDDGHAFGAFTPNTGACSSSNSVPSGAQCAIIYEFQPRAAQAYAASTGIVFSDGSGNSLFSPVAVSGNGVGTLARVSPRTVDLGAVPFESSVSIPVIVTNTSTSPLTNFTGGSVNSPFNFSSGCGPSLSVGATCALTYTFYAPSAVSAIKARYVATTLLTFTNASGIQPVVSITIAASVGDRLFGDGFEG